MADIINLKQVRKRREKAEKEKRAETNRARFGRTKVERQGEETARVKAEKSLDQHRLDED